MKRFLLLLTVVFVTQSQAQDLNETLSQVGELYARAYVDPLADALGADLNTGLFHTASVVTRFGFNVYLGVKAPATLLKSTQKSFDLQYSGRIPVSFDLAGTTISMSLPATFNVDNAPTIFGEDTPGQTVVTVMHDTTFSTLGLTLPVSFDSTFAPESTIEGFLPTNVAPLLVPQIGLGTVLGTDVMARWLPKISIPDVGSISLFGFGVRHSISQYIPAMPIEVALQTAWQKVQIENDQGGDFIEANTFAVNLALSKSFGILTVYTAVQSERSDIDFSYVFNLSGMDSELDLDPIDVNFTLESANKTRGIFGLGVQLGPVVINTDVGVGQLVVVSTGLGVAF